MKIGIDTNVLVAAHMPAVRGHDDVKAYLVRNLGKRDVRLVVTPLILHEFVHVITDPKRFSPPVVMSEALAVARLYLLKENVECAPITETATIHAFELLERHRLGRQRIADTLLVAALLEHGAHRLLTRNSRDFAIFEDLEVIDPLS